MLFGYPLRTLSMASPSCSVVVMDWGKSRFSKGSQGWKRSHEAVE